MPERGFNTEFWADTFVESLPPEGKLLYAYLWTNPHCNQAGLYQITLRRMAYETNLPEETLPDLLKLLEPKVKWDPDQHLIWVKNFIKHQCKSPTFLTGVANRLKNMNNNGVVKELIDYNYRKYSISIPYTYSMDTVGVEYAYPTKSSSNTRSSTRSGSKTGKGGVSLFGSFSLLRSRLWKAASGSIDRTVERERIKQELAQIGREQGLDARSEWQTEAGPIDLCLVDSRGDLVAAFEVDVCEPGAKSLSPLGALACPIRCIISLTAQNPYHSEQGIHVIGLAMGERETTEITPASESENGESLSSGDREVISVWRSVKEFRMSSSAAAELVAKLRTDFPDVDILAESKKWAARKLSEPLTKSSRPSGQIYNFIWKRHKWNQEQKGNNGADKGSHGKTKARQLPRKYTLPPGYED